MIKIDHKVYALDYNDGWIIYVNGSDNSHYT